jgi:DNA polymerase-3 subunit epsilon
VFWQRLFGWGQKPETSSANNLLDKVLHLQPKDFTKPWNQYEYLAIDCEFSSLSINQGDILSIGWVSISNGRIQLNRAEHLLVKNRTSVGQSATIHSIRDCERDQGAPASIALEQLLAAAEGKILLFHHAKLDVGYLTRLSKKLYNRRFDFAYCDTFEFEHALLNQQQPVIAAGSLTLASCRSRYHLPSYPQHNALDDAIATAELFLAQAKSVDKNQPLSRFLV